MLSDSQLVYVVPRNSIQLLNKTKFQVERESVLCIYIILFRNTYRESKKKKEVHFVDGGGELFSGIFVPTMSGHYKECRIASCHSSRSPVLCHFTSNCQP